MERITLWHPPPIIRLIIVLFSLILISSALADSPADNDIPTLAMRLIAPGTMFYDITYDLLCELSWKNIDAVNFGGWAYTVNFQQLMLRCDSLGMFYSICPREIEQYSAEWADSQFRYWFRYSDSLLTSTHAFARCSTDFESILQYMPADSLYYANDTISIEDNIDLLAEDISGYSFLWHYEVYDEANAKQGNNVHNNTLPWDDYIPNVFIHDIDISADPPILIYSEVEASGIFSLQKHYAEDHPTDPVTFTLNLSLLHKILMSEYTGLTETKGWGTFHDQANCVRALMDAEYQPPPIGDRIPPAVDNAPEFIMFDYYPFRYVNPDSGTSAAEMCDDDWLFLIDHFEEGIDSTVIPAHDSDCPVYFFPQTFGVAAGSFMWNTSGHIPYMDYPSYCHRKPAPQEFRMLCNLALLHQAKGIFPYNLCSYTEPAGAPGRIMSSLIDRSGIAFDAPYEDWVYTGRWPDSTLEYIRPDSLPPWISGYDPLYTLPTVPDTSGEGQKKTEIWMEWLFEPYAELYNNVGDILGEVKAIGPEMYDLWWCYGDYSDGADISYISSTLPPGNFVTPVIKVFEDSAQETCYLFYVDRYCISDDNPYEISYDPADLPEHATCSVWLLDHSRRFIMKGSYNDTIYTFLDTLDAGESRLVELVDPRDALTADLRITSPDIWMISGEDTLTDMRATVNDSVTVYADFYNLGTVARTNVTATLYDSIGTSLIGTDNLRFSGLSFRPDSLCRRTAMQTASFGWRPDSTEIGAHRMTVSVPAGIGEPNTNDNSVEFVFLVDPRDYATDVLGDSWDMDDSSSIHAWHTDDIDEIDLDWDTTAWTDSVSGMFEGILYSGSPADSVHGAISLAIPEDSLLDSDKYHMLSLGITVNNPNISTFVACKLYIGWMEDDSTWHDYVKITGSVNYVRNGWQNWMIVGPLDLDGFGSLDWGDEDVSEIWLRLSALADSVSSPDPVDVRIGWVRLEESAP